MTHEYCDTTDKEEEKCIAPCICPEVCDSEDSCEIPEFCELCPDPDIENDTLPRWLRIVAQTIGAFFEFHVVFLAILPWWTIGIVIILVDVIIDYLFYLIFFAFCKPCSYTITWIFNIAMFPLHLHYWYQRLQLELVGFIFDGWTLILGGDGCFARWGQDCWFARKIRDRGHLEYLDLVWLTIGQTAGVFKAGGWWETDTWYDELGFPGSIDHYYNKMEARKQSFANDLGVRSGPGYVFHDLQERIVAYTADFMSILHDNFDF